MAPDFEGGRYRLQSPLAPEASAWLAEDLEDPARPVVIKLLPDGADAIAARHVVQTLASANQSLLSVPADEGELPDGRPFLVFPYLEGQNLREVLNSTGPMPFRRAAAILVQIGEGIAELHSRSIVHGSICPEHILIHHAHGHDTATVLGGGVFRVTHQSSASPAYQAPEQFSGAVSPLSDIFSLAAVATEMLTGRRAFRYGSLDELHRMQRRGIARGALRKLRAKLPLRVEDELRRALSWDPKQRPPDIQILTRRLAEFLGGTRSLPRRRIALLGALGLAVIATGIRNCRRRWGR